MLDTRSAEIIQWSLTYRTPNLAEETHTETNHFRRSGCRLSPVCCNTLLWVSTNSPEHTDPWGTFTPKRPGEQTLVLPGPSRSNPPRGLLSYLQEQGEKKEASWLLKTTALIVMTGLPFCLRLQQCPQAGQVLAYMAWLIISPTCHLIHAILL